MSARDLGIIASELSQYSGFFKYSSLWLDTFTHESGRTEMANSNKLVKVQGFDGMATGSTAQSGYSLVATLKNGSARFICVVIGDQKTDSPLHLRKKNTSIMRPPYTVKTDCPKAGGKGETCALAGGREYSYGSVRQRGSLHSSEKKRGRGGIGGKGRNK